MEDSDVPLNAVNALNAVDLKGGRHTYLNLSVCLHIPVVK